MVIFQTPKKPLLANSFVLSIEKGKTFSNGKTWTRYSINGHFDQAIEYQLLISPRNFTIPRQILLHDQIFRENTYDSGKNGNRMVTTDQNREWTFRLTEDQSYSFYHKITTRSGSIVCDSNGQVVANLRRELVFTGQNHFNPEDSVERIAGEQARWRKRQLTWLLLSG